MASPFFMQQNSKCIDDLRRIIHEHKYFTIYTLHHLQGYIITLWHKIPPKA